MTTIPIFTPKPCARQHDVFRKLGLPSRGADLYRAIEVGISYTVFAELAQLLGTEERDLAQAMDIQPATLRRRAQLGRFDKTESDMIYRLVLILRAAHGLFEDDSDAARCWLTRPARGLGGRRPIEMAITSAQTSGTLELVGRLEHGIAD